MSPPDEDGANPYRAPESAPGPAVVPVRSAIDPALVKSFRQQIHALGGLWILMGSLAVAVAVAGFGARAGLWGDLAADSWSNDVVVLLAVAAVAGSAYLALGVAACLKHVGAVYAGLALTYLSLVVHGLSLNLCGAVIALVVIVQAHRVIGWSKQMDAAGVPPTTKPGLIARKGPTGGRS